MSDDLTHRFSYHAPLSDETRHNHEIARSVCWRAADVFEQMLPEGREKALSITKLEEAMFWANAAIARHQ